MKPLFQEHRCLTKAEIHSYLNGSLQGDERHRVENHLLDCPFCDEAVEGLALQKQAKAPRLRALRTPLSRIAATLALIVIPALGLLVWKSTEHSRLYQAYFESYDSDLGMGFRNSDNSTTGTEMDATILEALEAYEEGYFAESIPSFEKYLEEAGENSVIRFYIGMASLEAKEFDKAIRNFEIARTADQMYQEEANWYLALSLIHEKKVPEAKKILSDLATRPTGRYYEKAKELVSKL